MTEPNKQRTLQLDEHGRLAHDLICISCEYNLRGAEPQGRCPECGTAVERSGVGHWLRYCDPRWLRKIWWGLNCQATLVISIGLLFLLGWSGFFDSSHTYAPEILKLLVMATVVAVGITLVLIGWWASTEPEPMNKKAGSFFSARVMARVLSVPAFFLFLISLAANSFSMSNALEDLVDTFLAATMLLALTFIIIFTLWYARSLAKRIPNGPLSVATLSIIMLFSIVAISLNLVVFNWFDWQGLVGYWWNQAPNGTRMGMWFYDFVSMITDILNQLLLACGILLFVLFIWYWRALKSQADLAKQSWARNPFEPKPERTHADGES